MALETGNGAGGSAGGSAGDGGAGGAGDGGMGVSDQETLLTGKDEAGAEKDSGKEQGKTGAEGGQSGEDGQDKGERSEKKDGESDADKDKDKTDKDDPADQVPEDGNYDLKMPDGVELDQEMLGALGPEFKELGLTHKQAQALADKYTEILQGRAQQQAEQWSETVSGWVEEAKADKEIGGDNWDATVEAGQRAVERLGTPALRDALNSSGLGNHPELIRIFAKVGAMIGEDDPADGGGGNKPADAAHLMFPNDVPKGS